MPCRHAHRVYNDRLNEKLTHIGPLTVMLRHLSQTCRRLCTPCAAADEALNLWSQQLSAPNTQASACRCKTAQPTVPAVLRGK